MRTRLTTPLLAGGVVLAALILPSAASAAPALSVDTAKHRQGPFGASLLTANVSHPKSVFMRAVSHGPTPQTVTLTDESGNVGAGDYRVRWFKGKHAITGDVNSGGYEFPLSGGASKVFRLQVKPKAAHPDPTCLVGNFVGLNSAAGFIAVNGPSACP